METCLFRFGVWSGLCFEAEINYGFGPQGSSIRASGPCVCAYHARAAVSLGRSIQYGTLSDIPGAQKCSSNL